MTTKSKYYHTLTRMVKIIWLCCGEDMEQMNVLHDFNGSGKWYTTLENSFMVSYKHMLTIWPTNSTSRYLTKRNKNIRPYEDMCCNVHSKFILNGHKLEIIQTSFNWRMGKQTLGHAYNRILFNNTKWHGWKVNDYASGKRPDSK